MKENIDFVQQHYDNIVELFRKINIEYPNLVTIHNKLHKNFYENINELGIYIDEVEDEMEELKEEINDLEEEVRDLTFKYKSYDYFSTESLKDKLKLEIIIKAFNEYSLEQLEEKLNLSWV